jgi:hypothetical protein
MPATRTLTVAFDVQCSFARLPTPTAEFRFHPERRWRFDWAWPAQKLALEVNGGAFLATGGRHTRGAGFRADNEKFSEAAILGWRVLYVLPEHLADGRALMLAERALAGGHVSPRFEGDYQ